MASRKRSICLKIVLYLIVVLQMVVAFMYSDMLTFSSEGIKYATAVYDGGSFSLFTPVMSLTGLICRLIHMHPLVFTHTVMIVVIPLAYFAYGYLFRKIWEDNTDLIYISLLVVAFINIYGFWSDSLSKVSLLTGYFTGAGILFNVIMPLLAGILIGRIPAFKELSDAKILKSEISDELKIKDTKKDDESGNTDEELEEWDMKKHPFINARNLAIALAVLAVVLLASIFVLNNKINTLYDATVNLQNQLNEYVNESGE